MTYRKLRAMTTTLMLLLLAAPLVLALQRNHNRQPFGNAYLAGSTTAHDRDLERVLHDLDVAAHRSPAAPQAHIQPAERRHEVHAPRAAHC